MLTTLLLLLSACLTAGKFYDSSLRNDIVAWEEALLRRHSISNGDVGREQGDADRVYDTVNHESNIESILEKRKVHEKRHHKKKDSGHESDLLKAKILMPHVSPKEPDTYFCTAYKIPKGDRYIVKYEPAAKMQIAHHMLMYGCGKPYQDTGHWSCREMKPVCSSGSSPIVYAWGKNAPALKMPKDVGFHVGGDTGLDYLVLQVHYLNVSSFKGGHTDNSGVKVTFDKRKKDRLAGIYLLAGGWPPIQPHIKKTHVDMGCFYPKGKYNPKFTVFRFRVHAHSLGRVISAYRVRNDKWTLIGRNDPLIPQAFYRTKHEIEVRPGDTLMGRCTYNSESRSQITYFGAKHTDEMCNFYMMYYYDPNKYGERTDELPCRNVNPLYYFEYPGGSDELDRVEGILLE